MHTPPRTSLLVVEDHAMLRESLVDYLRAHWPHVTVAEAASLAQALQAVRPQAPDLILLDLTLQDASGFSALSAMRRACPASAIVVLSALSDDGVAQHLREQGADGFVAKSGRRDELLQALLPLLYRRAAAPRARHTAPIPAAAGLTPRQLVVLQQMLEGRSNKDIAQHTGLSHGTVRNHVSDVFTAFDVHSRSQLLALFRR